jgi:DNA uptake protein ComE-like DNA-binding protein
MNLLKSHFVFNRSQRGGIFLLTLLIVVLLLVNYYYDFKNPVLIDVTSSEVIALQKEVDSIRLVEIEARKPKRYPFNPNYMTDFKAYTLGLSPKEFDRLKYFRSKSQWINSAAEFKRVTKVSDSVLAEISPLFKFPDWVTNPKPRSKSYKKRSSTNGYTELTFAQKIDLNLATIDQLQMVSGIGEALSGRVISYREKLGGFSADIQLYSVWGLRGDVVKRILNVCTVKTPKLIKRMDVNTASASDIATIPGVSFDLAKQIWEFVKLRERIESVSELEKIEGLSEVKLNLIQLYLLIEQ